MTESMSTRELMDAEEVAQLLGVDRSWVHRAARENRIPHVKLGRYQRFRRDSILEWLEEIERPAS